MVEGHQCHRVAHAHRKSLLGKAFKATSPNGRFTDGAAAIDGRPLTRIEVHGKNLFYFFGGSVHPSMQTIPNSSNEEEAKGSEPEESDGQHAILHFHFGMSGAFLTTSLPGPDPKPTVRLRLVNQNHNLVCHLSAMTVQHGDLSFYEKKVATLGEDPLRADANPDLVWQKISTSKKSIGLLLMDQSVIAGVGNIYRAEILFKAGLHPEQPGNSLDRSTFDDVWRHCVELLDRGMRSGSIITVDPEEAAVLGPPWTRRYVYNQSTCGRCRTKVSTWDMASRTVYACTTCQPLRKGTLSSGFTGAASSLPADRQAALQAAAHASTFVSHCAPDDVAMLIHVAPEKLPVKKLKEALMEMGLPVSGRKAELVARLLGASTAAQGVEPSIIKSETEKESGNTVGSKRDEEDLAVPAAVPTPGGVDTTAGKKRSRTRSRSTTSGGRETRQAQHDDDNNNNALIIEDDPAAAVYPEIYTWDQTAPVTTTPITAPTSLRKALTDMPGGRKKEVATAREAALEKIRAGEGRHVEHVALQDEETLELINTKNKNKSKKKRKGAM